MITGRCECGSVAFEVDAVRDTVTVCHCSQCRRTSGHLWASTVAPADTLRYTCDDGLAWYRSSDFAERGFCKACGSSLFYRMDGDDKIAIAAGCLDTADDLTTGKHIFVKDKAGYYEIGDGAPQFRKL